MEKDSSVLNRLDHHSKDWMVACLDPFHDFQLSPAGLPDERTAPSVVQMHVESYTLTAPTSAGTGNWDASVAYTGFNTDKNPLLNASGGMYHRPSTALNSSIHDYVGSNILYGRPFGSLNIWAGAPGVSYHPASSVATAAGETAAALGSVIGSDRCRLVGTAFEIANTTAPLYRQGSLTVAQLQDCETDNGLCQYIDRAASYADPAYHKQTDRGPVFATTPAYLRAVPGSQTWAAESGVYAIPRMTTVPHEIRSYARGVTSNAGTGSVQVAVNSRIPICNDTEGFQATLEPAGMASFNSDFPTLAYSLPGFHPYGVSGFSPLQVFLTGLSPQTTLTITFRTIVEYFPSLGSVLLPLAQPSPGFDPKALRLYGEAVALAPYAVTIDQNPGGEYFRKVLNVLAKAAVLASGAFGELGPLVYGGGKILEHYTNAPRKPSQAGAKGPPRGKKQQQQQLKAGAGRVSTRSAGASSAPTRR